jgi:hypothetical protein
LASQPTCMTPAWVMTCEPGSLLTSTPCLASLALSFSASESVALVFLPLPVTVTMPAPGTSKKDAQLAQMVEHGMGPGGIGTQGSYDIRKFMLDKGKVKWGKNGPYVDVPFARRGRKSTVKGALEIARIGSRSTLTAARRLTPRIDRSGGDSLGAGFAGKIKSRHVADALQGLRRTAAMSSKGTLRSTGFVLWRRMSWNSTDPDAWRSPGIKAHNLARAVDKLVPGILRKAT